MDSLKELLPSPEILLRGPRGPWPEEQERLLALLLEHNSMTIPRGKLLKVFGSRHQLNRALSRLNVRLKSIGLTIQKREVYVVERTKKSPTNQLPLFK